MLIHARTFLAGMHYVAAVVCFGCLTTVGVADEPAPTAAADWPQWRGPRGDGQARGAQLPERLPSGEIQPLWTAATAEGWSSPIIAEGRVFVTDRVGNEERLSAFDATNGELLWRRANPVAFEPHEVGRRHGNGPKSTPVYSDGRVYSLGIAGHLQCVDAAEGKPIWVKILPADFGAAEPFEGNEPLVNGETNVIVPVGNGQGAPVPLFGYTGSLLIVDDLLIAPVGGANGGTIIAFNKVTGVIVWQALQENVSYSSPIAATIGGVRQVVVMTGPRVVGLAVTDGKLLWSFDYQNPYDESIGTPVFTGDLVIVTATQRPLSAHRIAMNAGGFQAETAWTNHEFSSYLSSMVVVGEHLYGMNDGGAWHCIRVADGKAVWRGGDHGFYSTPIVVGSRLLGLNEQGELAVLGADSIAYHLETTIRLSREPTWTSPAIVDNRLYVRSRSALACFELKTP